MSQQTALDALVNALVDRNVRYIFGVPGGDCSLDLIARASAAGIRFILCRTENAAGMAASVTAELTDSIGVVMTTRGPGIASGVNGVAYAHLDRAPLLLIADSFDPAMDYVTHQRFDQEGILKPLLRGSATMNTVDPIVDYGAFLDIAKGAPWGPLYLEMTNKGIAEPAPTPSKPAKRTLGAASPEAMAKATELVSKARKPVVVVGSQANEAAAARAVREVSKAAGLPVYTTYRAKGAVPDTSPLLVGHYIGGVAEEAAMHEADLVILYGFDAVEFPPGRWRYRSPVIEITTHPFEQHIADRDVSLVGDLAHNLTELARSFGTFDWQAEGLAARKAEIHGKSDSSGPGPISPQMLVDSVKKFAPANARITLDAGAHMLPILHQFECDEPRQTLLSRGSATMGFAVPAALGSCLADPDRTAIAFTGDGGMMMCAGELATAIQYGCKPVIVVFNDASLTLIANKQRKRQFPNEGVDFSASDFAKVAEGFGCAAFRVEDPADLDTAFAAAFSAGRAALVDVCINPEGYDKMLTGLRG